MADKPTADAPEQQADTAPETPAPDAMCEEKSSPMYAYQDEMLSGEELAERLASAEAEIASLREAAGAVDEMKQALADAQKAGKDAMAKHQKALADAQRRADMMVKFADAQVGTAYRDFLAQRYDAMEKPPTLEDFLADAKAKTPAFFDAVPVAKPDAQEAPVVEGSPARTSPGPAVEAPVSIESIGAIDVTTPEGEAKLEAALKAYRSGALRA